MPPITSNERRDKAPGMVPVVTTSKRPDGAPLLAPATIWDPSGARYGMGRISAFWCAKAMTSCHAMAGNVPPVMLLVEV